MLFEENKIVKQLKIIAQEPKTTENPNIFNIKSYIVEHPNYPNKLSKTIKQAKKIGASNALYNETKKSENFFNEKNVKLNKRSHACRGYAST